MNTYKRPWETTLAEEEVRLFPDEDAVLAYLKRYPASAKKVGVLALVLYRQSPEQDHINTWFNEGRELIITYGQEELCTWIGGVALSAERERVLHLANRENGSFENLVGWRPLVACKDSPTKSELENWIEYEASTIDEDWEHQEEGEEDE